MNFEMSQFTSNVTTNQVLNHHDLLSEITNEVLKVQALLHIRQSHCLLLLQKFNWDREAIRESYHASSSLQQFMIDNGVMPKAIVTNKSSECTICCTTKGELLGLACGDVACRKCWKSYFTRKIEDKQCVIECLNSLCNLTVCTEKFEMLLEDPQSLAAHQKLVIENFVEKSPNFTWCNKKCGMAVSQNSSGSNTVTCSCGSKFCFSCRAQPHLPATCRQIQLWNKKCSDQKTVKKPTDGVSLDWLLANTKECPKCLTDIQKSGGCKWMTCRKRGCGHTFCWFCRTTSVHGETCTRSAIAAEKSRLKSRQSLHIFAQYFHRFDQNKKTLIEEQTLNSGVKDHMGHTDLQYSLAVLLECRQTLMNSYVFSYYLKEGSYAKNLEKHQKNLEKTLEQLSKLLIDRKDYAVVVLKQREIVEKCQRLQNSLTTHCAKGNEHEDQEGRKPNKTINVKAKTSLTQDEIENYFVMGYMVVILVLGGLGIIVMILALCGVIEPR